MFTDSIIDVHYFSQLNSLMLVDQTSNRKDLHFYRVFSYRFFYKTQRIRAIIAHIHVTSSFEPICPIHVSYSQNILIWNDEFLRKVLIDKISILPKGK